MLLFKNFLLSNSKMINNKIFYEVSGIIYDNGNITNKHYDLINNIDISTNMDSVMFQIASCSKFVTSILVARMFELGKLDYDTDINKYLRSYKCKHDNITLRHLLTHTSGSNDKNGYSGHNQTNKLKLNMKTNTKIIKGKTGSRPFNIINEPGTVYMYSGAGYQVVQQILEDITDKPLFALLNKFIFKPLKMKNSTGKLLYEGKHKYNIANTSDTGYKLHQETASAGIWMSPHDLLKLSLDIMKGYNNNKSKILKQDTILMITKGEHPEWQDVHHNFGLGMIIDYKNGKKIFGHNGMNYGFSMDFYCIPDDNYIYIAMNSHNPTFYNLNNSIEKMLTSPDLL